MCLSFIHKAKQEGPEDELLKVQVKFEITIYLQIEIQSCT